MGRVLPLTSPIAQHGQAFSISMVKRSALAWSGVQHQHGQALLHLHYRDGSYIPARQRVKLL